MKKITLLLVALLYVSVGAWAQAKNDIVGIWLNSAGEGQIEIYQKGNKFYGKMVWLKEPNNNQGHPKMDINNPSDNEKSRPILGLELLKDFVYDDGKWSNGTIYDPRSGKTYNCNITLKGGKLNVRGYVGVSLFGKTEIFTRIK